MAKEKEDQSGAKWESDLDKFLQECDVVSINVPLSDKTRWVSYSPKQKNVAIFFVHHL
jgi:phosphoglycerate dehydrogenase-like enzyme